MPSSRSACALASTSRRRIFSAPATASTATCSCRASIALSSGGQMNLTVNQMNSANAMACAMIVAVKLIATPLLRNHRKQGIGEREHHSEADADDEGRVDQAEQQEHLGLE